MPKTYCRSKPNTASFFDWIATPEPTLHMILHSRRHHAGACLVLMVCEYCMIQWSCTCSAETQNTTYGKQILLVLLSPRRGLHVVCVFTSHLGVDPTLPSSGSSSTLTDILQLSLSASPHDHLHYTSNWWNLPDCLQHFPASNWHKLATYNRKPLKKRISTVSSTIL